MSSNKEHAAGGAIRDHIGIMLGQGLRAYQAFTGLAELAEGLRILSLNAELAAGRAGSHGRGIRALTQLTRELVRQLATIDTDMARLKGRTYGAGAEVLKRARRLRLLEAAGPAAGRRTRAGMQEHGSQVASSIDDLARQTVKVAAIARQARTVATNIAIEAAHAGAFGREFVIVADTMGGYAERLSAMIAEAEGCVARAADAGRALRDNGQREAA